MSCRALARSSLISTTARIRVSRRVTFLLPAISNERPSRAFHATPRREAGPLFPILASLLKSSYSLEIIRTVGRVMFTFVPALAIGTRRSRRRLDEKDKDGSSLPEAKRGLLLEKIRRLSKLNKALIAIPVVLVLATTIASLERTPLTGRWRFILLSPEEEDAIAKQLAGPGWYAAVQDILAQEYDHPTIVPFTDWRYAWVEDTLRRLECTVPLLTRERHLDPTWLDRNQNGDGVPFPPPAEWPLLPRPRAMDSFKSFCKMLCEHKARQVPHGVLGPPYSLIIVDKPDACNAFSFGFGPDGGGGIVVYSGFLDDVLSKSSPSPETDPQAPPAERSWFSSVFGSLISPSTPARPPRPIPTPMQTSSLAILLAHELSHLILCHHLESMSSTTVVVPALVSFVSDLFRVALFPVTMIFGPFVNDAVGKLTDVGGMQLASMSEFCTNMKQEIEADVVSARLLAHAGFDARHALQFWEARQRDEHTAECSLTKATSGPSPAFVRRYAGEYHPGNTERVKYLREELRRWEEERKKAVKQRKERVKEE